MMSIFKGTVSHGQKGKKKKSYYLILKFLAYRPLTEVVIRLPSYPSHEMRDSFEISRRVGITPIEGDGIVGAKKLA